MTLLEEIQAKCTPEQIADKNYHVIAATVNSSDRVTVLTTMISERGILERYPDGPIEADAVLSKLEAFSNAGTPYSSIVKRALKFLATSEGLDIGSFATRAMLDLLAANSVITIDEATKLKSLASSQPNHVTWEQCQAAMESL